MNIIVLSCSCLFFSEVDIASKKKGAANKTIIVTSLNKPAAKNEPR